MENKDYYRGKLHCA